MIYEKIIFILFRLIYSQNYMNIDNILIYNIFQCNIMFL